MKIVFITNISGQNFLTKDGPFGVGPLLTMKEVKAIQQALNATVLIPKRGRDLINEHIKECTDLVQGGKLSQSDLEKRLRNP